ncbi:MAG: dTDP-glucose 4,6-dehydratase [Hyphomicrobiales bacterium]
MTTFLVTGGAGFIGSNFVHRAVAAGYSIVNLDALSYAGNLDNLTGLQDQTWHKFVHGSINDRALVAKLLLQHQPTAIVNFAAETHVDRSIDDPGAFIRTNIGGTYELLEAALAYWRVMPDTARANFRFLHVSTDEVYGSIAAGKFTEESRYTPNSPYAASKAAADHLARAFHATYGLPILITNCGNNYGPRQFPEKLIPHMILTALAGQPLPVYGDGMHVRDWLHVDDHCAALLRVIESGKPGNTYNVGGHGERPNVDVVNAICDMLDRNHPRKESHRKLISYVTDRPGHDRRYSLDASKLERELGWRPAVPFETGLAQTVTWYLENLNWCERIKSGGYRVARAGLGRAG